MLFIKTNYQIISVVATRLISLSCRIIIYLNYRRNNDKIISVVATKLIDHNYQVVYLNY
jgi:hypothetical protein